MAKPACNSVDEYIDSQPEAVRGVLHSVRDAIRKMLPKAVESISYQIPTYKTKDDGRPILYFAGWKKHYSIYPASAGLVAAFKDDLAPYKVEKGTIRFPLNEPVPVKLIMQIAKFRSNEAAE